MSVAFDRLKFVERLEAGGFSLAQAKAAAEAFADATSEQLTTKSDLRELGTDLRAEITRQGADLRAEIARQGADLRAEIAHQGADIRGEIAPVKADVLLLKWMIGFVLAFQIGIFAKLFMH